MDESDDEIPEPCTDAAMLAGCTCRLSAVHSASIDPPEPVLDINCPVHGKYRPGGIDPDDEADRRREDDSSRERRSPKSVTPPTKVT